jgi:hypothetical protein
MPDTKPAPDLSVFEQDYDIIGELDSADASRVFIASRRTSDDNRRREDRPGVMITVVGTPAGDEANALTQFAADAGTLAGLSHRRLVPVIESRWLGEDQFAVVTLRVMDPTVAQKLATGEVFHSTRIAAILREVNGLLEWAREQKIVHRRVTPDNIYLEPNTDRVRVTFAIAPIRRLQQPGSHEDARTIARLAVAMLGGDPNIQACDQDSLLELRPGLPQRFCDATVNLLDPNDKATPEDVASYVSLIGMADPLVEGETERDRIRAEILEEQRVEQERLKNEREAFDRQVADERAAFEKEMADERAAFEKLKADERAAFEKAKEEERARVEKERLELQSLAMKERAELQKALADERAALLATRAELEKSIADQRTALEQAAAKDRAELERLRMELRQAGELEVEKKRLAALEEISGDEESVLDDADYQAPPIVLPMYAPLDQIVFDEQSPLLSEERIVFTPTPREEVRDESFRPAPLEARRPATPEEQATSRRRRRILIGAGAAVVALGGVSAAVVASRNGTAAPVRRPVAATPRVAAPTAAAPTPPATPAPMVFTVDSATARQWLDSIRATDPVDTQWAVAQGEAEMRRRARARRAAEGARAREAQARAEENAGADGTISLPGATRASAPRVTVFIPREPTPRPDTTTPPPAPPR